MDAHASQWKFPPEQLVLDNDEVHVWCAALDLSIPRVQALAQTLAPDEQARANSFHFQKDRAHYIVARGLLRVILGRYYLSREPRALQFCYNAYGKPALAGEDAGEPLSFNMSHSHGMALYALARIPNIGVDIEHINRSIECAQIADRFFSPFEVSKLRSVPQQVQQEAFFNCWTRKEAYIKARGMGLALDLNLFDVSLAPGEPAAILNIREGEQDVSRWSLYDLSSGSSFKAALAVEGHPTLIKCWQWPGSSPGG